MTATPLVTYSPDGELITSETLNGNTFTYGYDPIGRLIRADDPVARATWRYQYDATGNLIAKIRYPYTIGTPATARENVRMLYAGNCLIACGNQRFAYYDDGKLLSDGNWTYCWETEHMISAQSNECRMRFRYNSEGQRIEKIVHGSWFPTTTAYSWHDERIMQITIRRTDYEEIEHLTTLSYSYDECGWPTSICHGDTEYTCRCDAVGSVIALTDPSGAEVVHYHYDAWGKLLSMTGTLANTVGSDNLIRFRGMIYDVETGLYDNAGVIYCPEYGRYLISPYVFSGNNPHSPR